MNLFEQITIEDFLKNHWEKKPFIFRNVIPQGKPLIDINDIFNMASDEYYESRLISYSNKKWSVDDGPFKKQLFKDKNKNWTLINHNLDLYLEQIIDFKANFKFIPDWLFDDVMSTYSTKNSSVGAHIDNYNVFILQVEGSRVWEIQYNPNPEFQKGLDVKILKEFTPDTKYELTPGDMIYIPPHIAHHGISQSQSLSLSFGFKSLEDKQIIDRFAMDLINEYYSGDFYKTSFDKACNDSLEIDDKIITDLQTRMIKNLSDKNTFTKMLLKFTSSPKRFSEEIEITREEFDDLFLENNLYKDEFTRFSSKKSETGFLISINEKVFKVNSEQYTDLKKISDFTSQDDISVNKFSNLSDILYDLCLSGILYFNLDN